LLLLALLARLVSMALLPLTDPTEGRYAQVAQEMALSGDWVTPRVWMNEAHIPFLGKPPLFFWLAAGTMKVAGVSAFAARAPSLLAAVALLGLLYVVLDRYAARGAGAVAALATATCGFFYAVAGSVATDMALCACVAGSQLAYFAFLSEREPSVRSRWSLLVFLLLGLGFIAKGPVALALFGLPVLIWTARWRAWRTLRDHRWLQGALIFTLVAAPWYVACEAHNPGFLKYFFINENLLRFITPEYGDQYGVGHQYPRGSAIAMFAGAAAPWCLVPLVAAARDRARFPLRRAPDRLASFLGWCFLAAVLFWCLARQLLITYLLPAVPLFAAWLTCVMRDKPCAWPRMRGAAAALLAAQALVAVVCSFALRDVATARGAVDVAREYARRSSLQAPLIFERRTPYSALFYARGWVVPHPKEELSATLARLPGEGKALVVLRERQAQKLTGLRGWRAERVGGRGGWMIAAVERAPTAP
jgi:4-amino-4-deoxy-L-arabinose transferase-like glycosyltransferase